MHRLRWSNFSRWMATAGLIAWGLAGISVAQHQPENVRDRLLAEFGGMKIKSKGKPRTLPFDVVDKRILAVASRYAELAAATDTGGLETAPVRITFAELFSPDRSDGFIAVSNTIVKMVPDGTLADLAIYGSDGHPLGTFSNKYTYSRSAESSYTLRFFQYKTPAGNLVRTGPDILLDRFRISWMDVKDRPCLILPTGKEESIP